jgi:hypothetical protein
MARGFSIDTFIYLIPKEAMRLFLILLIQKAICGLQHSTTDSITSHQTAYRVDEAEGMPDLYIYDLAEDAEIFGPAPMGAQQSARCEEAKFPLR